MKNLVLFVIFGALLYYTYQHEEIGKAQDYRKKTVGYFLEIDQDKLKLFKGQNFSLYKMNDAFYTKKHDIKVSSYFISTFLKQLDYLKIHRVFTKKESFELLGQDFDNKILMSTEFFVNNKLYTLSLGPKSDFEKSFYVKISHNGKDEWMLVENDTPIDGPYDPKQLPENFGHMHFKKLMEAGDSDFISKSVFGNENVSKIEFDVNTNYKFTIDFIMNKTYPEIFRGLKYNQKKFSEFTQFVNQAIATKVRIPETTEVNGRLISQMKIHLASGKSYFASLYQKKDRGFILSRGGLHYELAPAVASKLTPTWQDFWTKVAIDDNTLGDEVQFQLSHAKRRIQLQIPAAKDFKVVSVGGRAKVPNGDKFKQLFRLLTGNSKFKDAARVSQTVNKKIPKSALDLEFDNLKLKVYRKGKELIISNLTYQYDLHYYMIDDNEISLDFNKYFY